MDCKCGEFNGYLEFKNKKEKEGYLVSLPLKDKECVNCHYEFIYGTSDEIELLYIMTRQVKKKYNADCNCGCYCPYSKHIEIKTKEGQAVAPMIPLNDCFNCFKIRKYKTLNVDKIKSIKMENAKLMLNARKKRKENIEN